MQKLFYNYIFKSVIIIVTISAFFPLAAIAMNAKDQKFEGYQVKFDYEGHPKEREIAYQYYLDEESKYMPGIEKKNLGIDLYDIDGDGKKEILVYIDGGEACPRAGCPFGVLRIVKDDAGHKTYKQVPWVVEKGGHFAMYKQDAPKILSSNVQGYHDFLFDENKKSSIIWRWNGRYYD